LKIWESVIFEGVENPSQNLDMTVKKGYNMLVYNVQENIRFNRDYHIIIIKLSSERE